MKTRLIFVLTILFALNCFAQKQKKMIDIMPTPKSFPKVKIGEPQKFTLSNGITVLFTEDHTLPTMDISLSVVHPPVYEGTKAGYLSILTGMLGTGTTKMTKDEFNEKVEFMGGSLHVAYNNAYASGLSRYFSEYVDLMSDALLNPVFKQSELDAIRSRMIENLKSGEKSASAIMGRVSDAVLYGKNTAFGEFVTEASLKSITLKDIEEAYNKYVIANNVYIAVVGDLTLKQIKDQLEKSFGQWKKKDTKFVIPKQFKNPKKTTIIAIDLPNAVQSNIKLISANDMKRTNPDYFAAILDVDILGGGGEGRLFMNLREKHAFTYGAYAHLSPGRFVQTFAAQTSVRNEVTAPAIKEMIKELAGMSKITEGELSNCKQKKTGRFIMGLESNSAIANMALDQIIDKLPKGYYKDYIKNVNAVTLKKAESVAKKFILPDNSYIFVVGKLSQINNSLKALGYPMEYYDKYANKIENPKFDKPSSDKASDVKVKK